MPYPEMDLADLGQGTLNLKQLWMKLVQCLDEWNGEWRSRSVFDAGPPRRASPPSSIPISNREAFEGLTLALLSGNTRWDRIEAIQPLLREQFANFDPERFVDFTDDAITSLVHWFRERKAGAARLQTSLMNLRATAAKLVRNKIYANADALFSAALQQAGHSPEQTALLLGTSAEWKLPGFGVPLAAEALRNMGFDLCKPDRHVLRAVASWKLVSFPKWDRRGEYTAPTATPSKLLETMLAVRRLADSNNIPVTRACSAIWIGGSVSGARLTNDALSAIAFGS